MLQSQNRQDYIYYYKAKGVRSGGLSPAPPLSPSLRGFGILGEMETPPRNVLLVVVVWCLRCNNQKEVRTKDPPSESARGGFVSGKNKGKPS